MTEQPTGTPHSPGPATARAAATAARAAKAVSTRDWLFYALISPLARRWVPGEAERVGSRAFWPRTEVERLQLGRCRRVLTHAADHVPYYRRLFAACGFDPRAMTSLSDLRTVPVLTRDALHHDFASLRDPGVPDSALTIRATGGTTGTPVKVALENRHSLERTLVTHRLYGMMGRHTGDRTLLIAGSPIDYERWLSLKERFKNLLMNVTVRSSFSLTAPRVEELVGDLRGGRYRFVIAYASVFDLLAARVERLGVSVARTRIVPCAELVTGPQRERWETALNSEVFELYGSREMPSIAGEGLEHEELLVSDDIYCLEVTDDAGQPLPAGTPGLITITSLLETAMPLIRYQLGDVGVALPPLPAGPSGFSRLRVTHGRVLDLIHCPGGKILPGEFFPHLFKEVSDVVDRYQVVQEDLARLTVKVVRGGAYGPSTTEYLRAKIASQVGPAMRIEFEFVEEIPLSASGKYRPTISRLPATARPWHPLPSGPVGQPPGSKGCEP